MAPTIRTVYVTSSSYSGSTLLAFLLNTHPDIFTVSEMDGWRYAEHETFLCSCGKALSECPLFRSIGVAFRGEGLPFDFRNFGTRYRLARSDRLNRYLTEGLTRFTTGPVEHARDAVVQAIPPFARQLGRQDRANLTFIRAALSYSGATVFVDACKSPFRLRHLRRIAALDLRPLYLVRDPRGVVFSNMVKWHLDAATAIRLWLGEQMHIVRIAREQPIAGQVYYEALCDDPAGTLAAIHRFIGVARHPFSGDFRSVEHHVLGNFMRLQSESAVQKDTRWRDQLATADRSGIEQALSRFAARHRGHPVSETVLAYLAADAAPGRLPGGVLAFRRD